MPPFKRILVVAPHPDDETLGVGGTIAKYSEQGHEVTVLVVSGHLPPLYPPEAYDATVMESREAFAVLGVAHSHFLAIPATLIGAEPSHVVNQRIGDVVRNVAPHVVLCPYPDRHVDHRLVFDSVMVATRPVGAARSIELLAAYETLSETHWNAPHIEPAFVPNYVVDITAQIDRKVAALNCYGSQVSPYPGPRSIAACKALAQFRGTQAGFAFGEGFHIIRMIG